LTVPEIDSAGALRFWYTHGIISEDSYHGALKYCDLTSIEPLQEITDSLDLEEVDRKGDGSISGDDRQKCEDFIVQTMDEMAGINIYDIYADVCINPTNEQQQQRKTNQGSPQSLNLYSNLEESKVGAFMSSFLKQPPQPRYDPCISNEVEIYMNRPDVQAAFNANSSEHRQPGPWVTCTPHIAYSREDVLTSMLPIYDQLLSSGLEFLIYSGDVDAIVPIIGTRKWIRKLNLEVEEKWRAWRSSTGQVAGWTVRHKKGLTFASVRGAGHMVPYTQAERAYHLFSRWVHGKPL
jgi:serine carboxypeptidase-like clade 2